MSLKYCRAFPCNQLAVNGAYCPLHRPAPPEKTTDPFYLSVAWRRFRDWYINQHPLCEQCEQEGRLTPAAVVDHIIEIKDGGQLTSEENAMSLCHWHHNRKTAAAQSKRKIIKNPS